MEIEHLSVSRVNTYIQCPTRYAMRYDLPKDKRPLDEGNKYTDKGTALHRALEKTLIEYDESGSWNTKHLQDNWVNEATKLGVSLNDIEQGKNVLLLWSKHYDKPTKILDIERRWEYEIEGVPVVFVPDLVEETYIDGKKTLIITDWKSSAMAYSDERVENDLQAPFYLHEMKRQYPDYDDYKFKFEFIFDGKVVWYNLPEDRWDEATNFLIDMYSNIANDKDPKPKPNSFCKFCPGIKTMLCPIAKRLIETGEVSKDMISGDCDSNDRLDILVSKKLVVDGLENIIKGIKSEVRGEISSIVQQKDTKSLEGNGYRITYNTTTRITYRPIDFLKAVGNQPKLILKGMDTKKGEIDKMIKNGDISEEHAEEMAKFAYKKTTQPVLRVYKSSGKKKKAPAKEKAPRKKLDVDSTDMW